ncbi:MAG: polysaccharide biosynthesis/export family protein [bacterium]
MATKGLSEKSPSPQPSPPRGEGVSGCGSISIGAVPTFRIDSNDHDDDYKIGAEDVLQISVWGNEHLNQEVIVRPDGKISFPLVNDLRIIGLTTEDLRKIITEKLASFISNPEVSVVVKGINSYKIYVIGAASSPGVIVLKRKTNLLQFLAMSGGLTLAQNADLKKAYILRNNKRLPVDFEKLVEEGDINQNVDLLPDDVIYIPDNFPKRITIIGEVKAPGTITYKNGITVLDAVLMTGGPTEDADLNDTRIVRKTLQGNSKEGKAAVIKVKLKDIMKKGKLEKNIKLEPGDTVHVPAGIL